MQDFLGHTTDGPEPLEERSRLYLFRCLFCQRETPGNVLGLVTTQCGRGCCGSPGYVPKRLAVEERPINIVPLFMAADCACLRHGFDRNLLILQQLFPAAVLRLVLQPAAHAGTCDYRDLSACL